MDLHLLNHISFINTIKVYGNYEKTKTFKLYFHGKMVTKAIPFLDEKLHIKYVHSFILAN